MNILERFEEVVIDNDSRISEDDRVFCINREQQFKEYVAVKNKGIAFIEHCLNSNALLLEVDGNLDMITNCFNGDIQGIKDSITSEQGKFFRDIDSHFKTKYNLSFESLNSVSYEAVDVNYSLLVDNIINQLEGMSLTEFGEDKLKADFRGGFYMRSQNPEVKGDKLVMYDYLYVKNQWEDEYHLEYDCKSAINMLKAISYFEQGSTHMLNYIRESLPLGYGKNITVGSEVMFSDLCEKVKSYKIYKNSRVDIRFHSKELAQEFFNTMELHKVPQSDR